MRRLRLSVTLTVITLAAPACQGAFWVRGGSTGKEARWGIEGGLQFALPPATPGPRGLIRILYPTLSGDARPQSGPATDSRPSGLDPRYDLINFIAIEPIVRGQRGYSELERSQLDKRAGKRLWVEADAMQGELSPGGNGVERLQVVVHVERFVNGAHVKIVIEQRADRPDEIALTIEAEPDCAEMECCILTATMGNRARARLLWLKDETVSSLKLYPDYEGRDFAPPTTYPLKRLAVTKEGDLIVAITSDEQRPGDVRPFPGTNRWYYGGVPVTQFWKKTRGTWRNDLAAIVNARFVYWMSWRPIPGGIAFENFELRERFYPQQQFIFGVTRRTPAELGIPDDGGPKTRPSAGTGER